MIERSFLEQYAIKTQTLLRNILREYCQNLFLSKFYQQKESEHFYFKGGTALKLVFNSPRFSEDLDFSADKNSFIFENILEKVLLQIQKEGIDVSFLESKKTTGGHLAIINFIIYNEKFEIKTEVSYRKKNLVGEKLPVFSDFFPSYVVNTLALFDLIGEKQKALLERQKTRDFFDLYFILRNHNLRRFLKIDNNFLSTVKKILEKKDSKQIEEELRPFLPKSFWIILKDFKENLVKELERVKE